MVQVGASVPVLRSGYAWVSSRRYPKCPEVELLGEDDCEQAVFVGFAWVDGYRHVAFRGWVLGRRRYFFQLG